MHYYFIALLLVTQCAYSMTTVESAPNRPLIAFKLNEQRNAPTTSELPPQKTVASPLPKRIGLLQQDEPLHILKRQGKLNDLKK